MGRTIPIIRLRNNLIVSIQVELGDQLIVELKDDIAEEIRRREVSGLIIEVSGVDVFDSYIARSIRDIAQLAHLMGVATVLAGLDAAMAVTLVEMGIGMSSVHTALNLEAAIHLLERDMSHKSSADELAAYLAESLGDKTDSGDA